MRNGERFYKVVRIVNCVSFSSAKYGVGDMISEESLIRIMEKCTVDLWEFTIDAE